MEINTGKLFDENVINISQSEYNFDDSDFIIEEEDLLEEAESDFSYQIIERGKNYYNNGNVITCLKSNNIYYGKVWGTREIPYNVRIEIMDEQLNYECDCPYKYPCKHEYALLVAISNQKYKLIELKNEITEKRDNLQNILSKIPAEEIKKYLLSPKGMDYVYFKKNEFEEYFINYYPNQSYEYYYNKLYNF